MIKYIIDELKHPQERSGVHLVEEKANQTAIKLEQALPKTSAQKQRPAEVKSTTSVHVLFSTLPSTGEVRTIWIP